MSKQERDKAIKERASYEKAQREDIDRKFDKEYKRCSKVPCEISKSKCIDDLAKWQRRVKDEMYDEIDNLTSKISTEFQLECLPFTIPNIKDIKDIIKENRKNSRKGQI